MKILLVEDELSIRESMQEFTEFFEIKSIAYELTAVSRITLSMDPDLARILFNNLINNAVKYTPPGGRLIVRILEKEIRFSNTGNEPLAGGEKIFNRFYRENLSVNSTGLGLALVKSICV